MKPKTSKIWQYFLAIDDNFATCITCGKTYSRKGRTTTSLKGHLRSIHIEKYQEFCKLEEQHEIMKSNQEASVTPLLKVKRQMSLEESSEINQMWDTSHPKARKMDDLIGEMIALQNLPFHFVEGVGFRRVMQDALPNYQLRDRNFFTEHICNDIYEKIADKIRHLLINCLKISFTADIWSEPSVNVSVLSLTAHAISENFTRIQIVLKCCLLYDRYTSDTICENVKMMLRDWNIKDEQLHCFIRDSGSNMVRAMHLVNIPDVSCTVHQLQLCVRSAFETFEVKELIAKCKMISGHFKHSKIAQEELTKIQKEQLTQLPLRIIQDSVTRWNSTFYMIERFLKIKDSLCLYASKHNIPQISPEEWSSLNKIVSILTPFEEIRNSLIDTKTCISSVIPMVYVLKHTLKQEKDKPDTNQVFETLISELIDELNSRFSDLSTNTLYSLATYLDPRYKLKFFNEIDKVTVQSELLHLLVLNDLNEANTARTANVIGDDDTFTFLPKKPKIELKPSTSYQVLLATKSVHTNLAEMLKNSSDDEENIESDDTTINRNLVIWKSLINEYNKEKRLPLEDDPLLWWKYHIKYKAFAPIVRIYLSAKASSVSSEQLFSEAGLSYEPLCTRLEGDEAAKRLFVKYNLPLLNFDY
ncbi:PREDICTED: zinc finger BED domain-containing protein 4 [Papilio polytes]|uniref:zinc finger BED domain-containing protein 4 n=1 Tax=Papilio polytes TaxID=76194 RepID=UPI000675D5E7|nr:PREDICTED: zinc finger BED domain-containing protein 4 [Papilio polytes]